MITPFTTAGILHFLSWRRASATLWEELVIKICLETHGPGADSRIDGRPQLNDAFTFWAEHMRHGEFEAAWRISDEVRRSDHTLHHGRGHFQSVWRGAPLRRKRVLIRCHHGLSDTIQFIRYAPLVKAFADEVIVSAQPELIPLLQTIPAIDRLVAQGDGQTPRYDVDIEVMELPYALRTSQTTIPADIPYFHVPKSTLPARDRLAVGIVWAAGDWDRHRSIPLPCLAPLASVAEMKLFAFQRGAALGQTEHLSINPVNWRDMMHEAALLGALDLLISVDATPAYLAGALGVPVWLLLHADADWRWMKARDDSPWYPTMRLFRQRQDGVWQPLLERVAAELRALSRARRDARSAQQPLV